MVFCEGPEYLLRVGVVSPVATQGACREGYRVGQFGEEHLGEADFYFFLPRSKFCLEKRRSRSAFSDFHHG